MLKIKNLRGECQHCGRPVEFHAEHVGTTAECPHCGQPTELLLALPAEAAAPLRRRAIIFAALALVILAGGLVATRIAFERARRLQSARPSPAPAPLPAANPFAAQEFRVSAVTLERTPGSAIVHAGGSMANLRNRPRFGVKVELQLVDAAGRSLGTATDYAKVVAAGGEWKFRALVVEPRTVTAEILRITETP